MPRIASLAGHGVMSLEDVSAMTNGMVPYAINAPLGSLRMNAKLVCVLFLFISSFLITVMQRHA